MEYKQVILVRKDLKLPKGKMAAQVAHAAVDCALGTSSFKMMRWKMSHMKKIVLAVEGLRELKQYQTKAKHFGLKTAMITDAGLTTVPPGTVTCLGIGPDREDAIDRVTGDLKMI